MPFIKRDPEGKIVALLHERESATDEEVAANDPDLMGYVARMMPRDDPMAFLLHSDVDLSRVLEDLIDLLVMRGIINFTDLPESAQNKLLGRRKARAELREGGGDSILIDDEQLKL